MDEGAEDVVSLRAKRRRGRVLATDEEVEAASRHGQVDRGPCLRLDGGMARGVGRVGESNESNVSKAGRDGAGRDGIGRGHGGTGDMPAAHLLEWCRLLNINPSQKF